MYLSIDGPEINAFNFNFVTQFPLAVGLNYPENAGVGLQLNLTYNSNVSHYQNKGIAAIAKKYMRIRRQNPFGLGFEFSLGRIVRPAKLNGVSTPPSGRLVYVDSSGANHGLAFYQTTAQGDEWRTHDGSHIQAIWANNMWKVSFPNGVVQELGHYISGPEIADLNWNDARDLCTLDGEVVEGCDTTYFVPDPLNTANAVPLDTETPWPGFDRDFVGWHVTKVYSRADIRTNPSSYTVEYFGADNHNDDHFAHVIHFIRDQHNRTIEFVLDRTHGTVTSIRTPAPGTPSGARPPAEYVLEYDWLTLTNGIGSTRARVLSRLWNPNLLDSAGTQRYLHHFDYRPSGGGNLGGQLSRIDYPSGRATVIAYQEYSYLNGMCPAPCGLSSGVAFHRA